MQVTITGDQLGAIAELIAGRRARVDEGEALGGALLTKVGLDGTLVLAFDAWGSLCDPATFEVSAAGTVEEV